jgi:hypothetical protein
MGEEAVRLAGLPALLRRYADFLDAREEGLASPGRIIPEARRGPPGRVQFDIDTDQEVILLRYVRRETGGPQFRLVGELLEAAYRETVPWGSSTVRHRLTTASRTPL